MVGSTAAESDLQFSDQQLHILLHIHDVGQACITSRHAVKHDIAGGALSHKSLRPCWWALITGQQFQYANSFKQTKTLHARQHDSVGDLHDHGLAS